MTIQDISYIMTIMEEMSITKAADRLFAHSKLDHTIFGFLRTSAKAILIFIAVESYLKNPHELGKYLGLCFGVTVFILAGFEHCVADMFYFALAGWTPRAFLCLLVITAGNGVGGVLFPLALGAAKRLAR